MTTFVAAVISFCIASASGPQCESHQGQIASWACKIKPVPFRTPINGEWKDATISVQCQGK